MPTLTGFAPSITLAENTVNATPQLLDGDVVFADAEGNFNGGRLTLSGLRAEDRASVRNEGTGAGQIGLSGSSVTYGGAVIGTLAGGVGGTLTITFNASATTAAIDALIQNLTYANVSDTPTASRNLVLNVTDAAGDDLGGPLTYTQRTQGANPFTGLPQAYNSNPVLVDLDGDGDLDAVVGARFNSSSSAPRYFENTGTATDPVFTARTGAANPFNAITGNNFTAPAFGDMDGDGDQDLVLGNLNGNLLYFENTGTAQAPVFAARTGAANPFNTVAVELRSDPELADLDGDGDLDVIVGDRNGSIFYFQNTGTAQTPVFTARTGVANPFNGIDLGDYGAVMLADLDGDGDLDALGGSAAGDFLYFENTGSASAAVFTARTGAANPFNGVNLASHSTIQLEDMDGDGDLDAVIGVYDGDLRYFENTTAGGQTITVNVTAQNDVPTLTGFAPSITLAENTVNATPQLLDGDVVFADAEGNFNGGRLTLSGLRAEDRASVRNEGTGAGQIGLSGSSVTYGGAVIGTLAGGVGGTLTITFNASATTAAIDALIQNLTYANVSDTPTASRNLVLNVTDAAGDDLGGPLTYTQRTQGANPFTGLPQAYNSNPVLVDLDGDGDLDAVVGARFNSSSSAPRYFENTGTATDPVFTARTGAANPFNAITGNNFTAPAFGDMDGDGDQDLVLGNLNGNLLYFENTGTAQAPVFAARTGAANPFNTVAVELRSDPELADLDGDGDLDVIVGDRNGSIFYFQNTGTAQTPVFTARTGVANPFNGIDLGDYGAVMLADLDGDGDLDALGGSAAGDFLYFENTGSASAAVFTARTGAANPFNGVNLASHSTIQLEDMDGDGDLDAVIGVYDGDLRYFENTTAGGQTITVNVTAQNDATPGNDTLTGPGDIDGLAGDDVIAGLAGDQTLDGGMGTDTVTYADAAAAVTVRLNQGTATDGSGGTDTLLNFENITGSAFADILIGDAGANVINGGAGYDQIIGGRGNDTLIGGSGVPNEIYGGLGDDTYVVSANDTLVELADEGTDTVQTDRAGLALRANFENLTYTGAGNFIGQGNGEANVITGGAGADALAGGGGDDTLIGGAGAANELVGGSGDDTYVLTAVGDTIVELADDGVDLVQTALGVAILAANVENLTFTDNATHVGTGNAAANLIQGGEGFDTLSGLGGDDVLIGGSGSANVLNGGMGDDTYVVTANDTIIEAADEGTDTVNTSRTYYVLSANVENLNFTGMGNFSGAGNAVANVLTGGNGSDTLRGAGGNDTLNGGSGFDTADFSGLASDYQIENLGGGQYRITDTVGGRDGVDILNGMEQARFTDSRIVLSTIQPAPFPAMSDKDAGPQVLPGLIDDPFVFKGADMPLVLPGEGIGSDVDGPLGFDGILPFNESPGFISAINDAGLIDHGRSIDDPVHDHWFY